MPLMWAASAVAMACGIANPLLIAFCAFKYKVFDGFIFKNVYLRAVTASL
jgi:hypothetical protein